MIQRVLDHYRIGTVRSLHALGAAGGFSGASLWKLDTDAGTLCLRKWPSEHPDEPRLQAIHQFVATLANHQLPVPAPLSTRHGQSYIRQHGAWWELAAWLPGVADYRIKPSPTRLSAAMTMLAKIHLAAATIHNEAPGASSALKQRFAMLEEAPAWVGEIQRHHDRIWPALRGVADLVLAESPRAAQTVLRQMADTRRLVTPLQWVVRDIWHDHLLFTGDAITGVVDFGAISIDTVATDLSRLLGSLCANDRQQWEHGLAAYEQMRPLSAAERELILALDRASVALSGLNWLRWIAVEDRSFDGREQEILLRLQGICERLTQM